MHVERKYSRASKVAREIFGQIYLRERALKLKALSMRFRLAIKVTKYRKFCFACRDS